MIVLQAISSNTRPRLVLLSFVDTACFTHWRPDPPRAKRLWLALLGRSGIEPAKSEVWQSANVISGKHRITPQCFPTSAWDSQCCVAGVKRRPQPGCRPRVHFHAFLTKTLWPSCLQFQGPHLQNWIIIALILKGCCVN